MPPKSITFANQEELDRYTDEHHEESDRKLTSKRLNLSLQRRAFLFPEGFDNRFLNRHGEVEEHGRTRRVCADPPADDEPAEQLPRSSVMVENVGCKKLLADHIGVQELTPADLVNFATVSEICRKDGPLSRSLGIELADDEISKAKRATLGTERALRAATEAHEASKAAQAAAEEKATVARERYDAAFDTWSENKRAHAEKWIDDLKSLRAGTEEDRAYRARFIGPAPARTA